MKVHIKKITAEILKDAVMPYNDKHNNKALHKK